LVRYDASPDILEEDKYYESASINDAWDSMQDFLDKQTSSTSSYAGLENLLSFKIAELNPPGKYGIYFEDLNTGGWAGINEEEKFLPYSLLKMSTSVAVFKKIQDGDLSLDKKIILKKEYLDSKSGSLYLKGAGYETTVRELLEYLAMESDNTAVLALSSEFLTMNDIASANVALGFPVNDSFNQNPLLSPKEYSLGFRSLYYSTYLRKQFSETALILLMNTNYVSQLPAGVPKDVKIAHKIGVDLGEGYYHDCGIIYYLPRPYILCVMTKNMPQSTADNFIHEISKVTYDYVSQEK
jgi:beta-lactamase class A